MTLPVVLRSDMLGAPQLTYANGTFNAIFNACLVNGFNTQSVVSATASGGVVTFNFASAPGFSAFDTVTVAGASNGTVNGKFRVQSAASNQVLVPIPGVPDGAVGGTITLKFAPLGWTRPYVSGTTIGAYRQGGGETFNRFLRVRDNLVTTDGLFRMRGYENMTAISTGTGPFPTTVQKTGDGGEYYAISTWGGTANTDPRPWILVGTPRAFYFMHINALDNYGVTATGLLPFEQVIRGHGTICSIGNNPFCLAFGDLANKIKPGDVYHTFIGGGHSYGSVGVGGANFYLPRKTSGVVGAVTGTGISHGGSGSANYINSGVYYPNPSNNGMTVFGPPFVYDGDTQPYGMRGFVPGMLTTFEGFYVQATSATNMVAPGEILTTITNVPGRALAMSNSGGQTYGDFLLLLDEDWGDV